MRVIIPIKRMVLVEKFDIHKNMESFLFQKFSDCNVYLDEDSFLPEQLREKTLFYEYNGLILLEFQTTKMVLYCNPKIFYRFCDIKKMSYKIKHFAENVIKDKIFLIYEEGVQIKFDRPSKYNYVINNGKLIN